MTYAVLQDFVDRFGAQELTDLTGSSADTPQLDQALADADAEIDAYLAVRYALPLSSVPPVLVRIACDVARYRLWDQSASQEVTNRYNNAVKFLTSVSTGVVKLGIEPEPDANAAGDTASTSGVARVFSRDTLCDY